MFIDTVTTSELLYEVKMKDQSQWTRTCQTRKKQFTCLFLGLIVILLLAPDCSYLKNPMRDYSEKSFNSQDWLKGDAIERGRMFADIYAQRILKDKSKEDVRILLGEPDKKQYIKGLEIWLYHVEHSRKLPHKFFPVSFEENGKTFAGKINDGTISILVEE